MKRLLIALACAYFLPGCTAESTRVAIETQRRVDSVQQGVFDRQHEGLRILLFRDLLRRLTATGVELDEAQIATLNHFWNERDLVEFWALQHERALGLRRVGVDAKLYADQAIVDLLWKSLSAKGARATEAIAGLAGAQATAPESDEDSDVDAGAATADGSGDDVGEAVQNAIKDWEELP